ncbi:MAG: hypothetical protein ACTSRK_02400, partial [Promethearchaeota archaeon]
MTSTKADPATNPTEQEEFSYELLTFTFVFLLFSLFGTVLIWIELESETPLLDRAFLQQFLFISLISNVLALIQLIRFFYKINIASPPSAEDYFPPKVFQLRGANVVDFYQLHQKFIMKDDQTFKKLKEKYQRNSAYFSFFSIVIGILIIIYFNRENYVVDRPKVLIEIFASSSIFLVLVGFMLFRLSKLSRHKRESLQIHSLEFNEYLDKYGVNLHTNPITKKQAELREFLELANFLQKYHQNYIRVYLKYLFNFLVFGCVGLILRFNYQSTELFQKIGFAMVFFSGIGFAISHSKFVLKRELHLMTKYVLNSY